MTAKLRRTEKGYTLMELLIAMGLGLVVVGAAVQLFSRSMEGTFLVAQRAEMQQDVRAAENMLVKDIGLAGAGLPPGGVALATGGAKKPIYGCDQAKCYVGGSPPAGISFPGGSSPYLYWLTPGFQLGPVVFSGQPATDIITVAQGDTAFPWANYQMSMNSSATTGTVNLVTSAPINATSLPLPDVCNAKTPCKLSDPAYGLKTGDLVLVSGKSGANTISAVGEVSANVTGTATPYTVSFSATDALGFNQSGATSNSLAQMKSLTGLSITRLFLITYYISTANGTPTLMRQVNGQTPAPVAENIINLQFQYDTYDDTGTRSYSSSPTSLNQIRKIELLHMTARSEMRGAKGYQTMDIQTSVSARNMSFKNRYQ